ncbi:hypothetical protein KC952_02280 [Candidatus Saccharibacteria bacterium]|jgi:hypothetical protein|nr:hypothetical protein [Candidatus Saccharibacteria bacterium]
MYSGTTIRTKSGRIMGAHQRIDRIARRYINSISDNKYFPSISEILHFEGKHGPDGIKRKSPGVDEPWHFIEPKEASLHHPLIKIIEDHIINLRQALINNNNERSAFEAAWLAHVITDGLTPAHHHAYEDELASLRKGEHHSTRNTKLQKVLMPGDNVPELIRNNWKYWGSKGLMTMHLGFELGVAAAITPYNTLDIPSPTDDELSLAREDRYNQLFIDSLIKINSIQMYKAYELKGWSRQLARQTRNELVPEIVKAVVLAWYTALHGVDR